MTRRVDVVAAALHTGSSVDDRAAFDLSCAPPYSPCTTRFSQRRRQLSHPDE